MNNTRHKILEATVESLAKRGSADTSMRHIAAVVGVEASVLYYYFPNKQSLVDATRTYIIQNLQTDVNNLFIEHNSHNFILDYIEYAFNNRVQLVALLQYFMSVADKFIDNGEGYIPQEAYSHLIRYIKLGVQEGRFNEEGIMFKAKTIQHLIDGFLVEYTGRKLTKAQIHHLANSLSLFIENALTNVT